MGAGGKGYRQEVREYNKQHLLCVYGMPRTVQNVLCYLVKASQKFSEEKAIMIPFYRSGNRGSNCDISGPQSKKVVVSNSGAFLS